MSNGYRPLLLRPYVKPSEQVMGLIGPSHCWHFDAWLLRDTARRLYIRVQTRAGGRELLSEREYLVEHGLARMVLAIPVDAEPITLQDRGEQQSADELNSLHSRYVMPWAATVPPGFRSRSVALHYVRCPDLAPFEGDEANWQQ